MTFPRSSRSTPSGSGSRGGRHPRVARAAWVADHPEYRVRERLRMSGRDRSVLMHPSFSDAVRAVLIEEAAHGQRALARRLAIEHSTVIRLIRGISLAPSTEIIDAVVLTYGLERVKRTLARLRRGGLAEGPADSLSPKEAAA